MRASLALALALACAVAMMAPAPASAQDGAQDGAPMEGVSVPALWPLDQRRQRPDTSRIRAIRFLTESDYPPFNFIDSTGQLVGFNVELAAALCAALKLECSIRTRRFEQLLEQLDAGEGDAVIASVAMSAANRARADFTDRYYLTPARFAARRQSAVDDVRPAALAGRPLGVVAQSAHEAYLRAYYSAATITAFKTREEARMALKDGTVDLVFDDGISLAFWLHGADAENCCAFRGGPFLESRYFGEGVGIAVKRGNDALRNALNHALREVYASGRYEEIFLRYFPLSFY